MSLISTLLLGVAPLVATSAAPPVASAPSVPGAISAPSPRGRGNKVEVERVELQTEDRLKLAADYYPPKSTRSRAPAAILVHDAGGSRSQLSLYAERLHSQGLAVLIIEPIFILWASCSMKC